MDCQKGTKVQVDSSQRMLRIADPDSRYSGYYSMQKHNNLQADNFYQTAWDTGERESVSERESERDWARVQLPNLCRTWTPTKKTVETDKTTKPSVQRRDPDTE